MRTLQPAAGGQFKRPGFCVNELVGDNGLEPIVALPFPEELARGGIVHGDARVLKRAATKAAPPLLARVAQKKDFPVVRSDVVVAVLNIHGAVVQDVARHGVHSYEPLDLAA